MLRLKSAIENGELIAIMGDRVASNERSADISFLGDKARFPTGAFFLASTLKCPVYLTFGLYRGGNRYDLHCERFEERVVLPRGKRDEAAQAYAERFAERLAYYCHKAPDNWFNFFHFWSSNDRS